MFKFKIGDRLKEKYHRRIEHDDYIILAQFESDTDKGYIIFNLYDNSITGVEQSLEKQFGTTACDKDLSNTFKSIYKDRYESVKTQIQNHNLRNLKFIE